jgi:hypothetical protein
MAKLKAQSSKLKRIANAQAPIPSADHRKRFQTSAWTGPTGSFGVFTPWIFL